MCTIYIYIYRYTIIYINVVNVCMCIYMDQNEHSPFKLHAFIRFPKNISRQASIDVRYVLGSGNVPVTHSLLAD